MKVIREYLGNKYKLVGVKFFQEVPQGYSRLEKPGRYCEFVKRAALGESILMVEEDEECPESLIALGFTEPSFIDLQPRMEPASTKAVFIAPLEEIEDPDVVLFILNPRQVMEISALMDGLEARFSGGIAICGEATAQPIKEGRPNLSFLCGGARMFADFKEAEIILGASPKFFQDLEEKVKAMQKSCGALCGCKTSDLPASIVSSLEGLGFEKGIDYFFGRVDGKNVRLYLNKDTRGRVNYITIQFPVKGEVEVQKPLEVKSRGPWSDVYATFKDGEGINLNSGKGVKETIEDLAAKVKV